MSLFTKSARWAAVMTCTTTLGLAGLTGCMSGNKSAPSASDKAAMMAAAPGNIIDVATGPGMEQVTTVVAAIKAAGLVDALKGPGPFTVFAPTNDAFNALPPGTLDMLMKPENQAKLKDILLYHVHSGDGILASEAKTMSLSTMEGKPLAISVNGDTVMVNDAKVVKANVICTNGVIHWVDKVLMPPAGGMAMPGM